MNIPIIKLEVQGMKHTVQTALAQYAAQMDSSVQAAIEAYCSDDNLNAVINAAVRGALEEAIKSEVQDYFRWSGAGREAVRAAVTEHLDQFYALKAETKE
jgi:hypothetical protein